MAINVITTFVRSRSRKQVVTQTCVHTSPRAMSMKFQIDCNLPCNARVKSSRHYRFRGKVSQRTHRWSALYLRFNHLRLPKTLFSGSISSEIVYPVTCCSLTPRILQLALRTTSRKLFPTVCRSYLMFGLQVTQTMSACLLHFSSEATDGFDKKLRSILPMEDKMTQN